MSDRISKYNRLYGQFKNSTMDTWICLLNSIKGYAKKYLTHNDVSIVQLYYFRYKLNISFSSFNICRKKKKGFGEKIFTKWLQWSRTINELF